MTKLTLIKGDKAVAERATTVSREQYAQAWIDTVRAVLLPSGITVGDKLDQLGRAHAALVHDMPLGEVPTKFLMQELRAIAALDEVGIAVSPTDADGVVKLFAALYSPTKLREHRRVLSGVRDEALAGMQLL